MRPIPEPDFGSVPTDSGYRLPIGSNYIAIITQSWGICNPGYEGQSRTAL